MSLSFTYQISFQPHMLKFSKTLGLLNRLISKLQANTGGQGILQSQKRKPELQIKEQIKKDIKVSEVTEEKIIKPEQKKTEKKNKNENKKPVEKAEPEKPKLPEGSDQEILIFSQVDLRISEIVQCWKHPESTYLYCERIMVGKQLREIASGLQEFIKIQEMKGKVIVMANLKPKPLGGFFSNGMVVCSSNQDNSTFELLVPDGPLGERLYLEGYEQLFTTGEQILPLIKKSKILQKCIEHFNTNGQGLVCWKNFKLRSKNGYIKSNILNGRVS